MKFLGGIFTCIGAIITFSNASTYISKSSEIQAWYYYKAELESARLFMIVGVITLAIGIIVLLAEYMKNNKK